MPKSVTLLKSARLTHLYFGVFITPALIFFAFTGAIQTFSLHETTKGSNYKPPAILVELGQLHKKQTIVVPQRKAPKPEAAPSTPQDAPQKHDHADHAKPDVDASASPAQPPTPATPPQKVHNLLPMKIFFLIVSIGLFTSTITGLYMAYTYIRNKLLVTLTLLAGVAVPLLLLVF
jgi:hypothetical protein